MVTILKVFLAAGPMCFVLFLIENARSKIGPRTTWKELSRHQIALFVGMLVMFPIGLFGLMLITGFSK